MGMRGIQLGLRLWQFIWTLLVMALIGNMLNESFAGDPATVNYCMFVSAWSMFTLFYLVPASFNLDWALSPILMVAIDLLNALFFLTAGIALASRLEAHSCSNEEYTLHNEITNGSYSRQKRCREAQASTAFLWFAWAGYTASFIMSFLMARRSNVNMRGRTGPARGSVGRPSMAQV
ncbi:MARVEL domain-containing protein [Aspergillus candidus]|uniref:Membrane-associating domain-domain-containing protein n=1 Tax=Aspergillus candidus TaxID=41067 RepID=A0A2I2FPU8_ASPCN|nr:membrane-associating domain-domain-containing protein [Aspergillus candidus]PLB42640.1 membrane-associating domain-domain-containing protein [Aspergillus candidus]